MNKLQNFSVVFDYYFLYFLCFGTKTLSLGKNTTDMELRIKELLREQGLRMTDLADRMGMNQSNLVRSLTTNPKLSTLQDVAKALNVQMHELFTPNIPSRPNGIANIGGRTYALVDMPSVVQVPSYNNYADLRKDVKNFITHRIQVKEGQSNAFCAFVNGFELMSLVYDRANSQFILTLYFGDMESKTLFYDKLEYAVWKNGDDKEPDWDMEQIISEVISDIENLVPFRYGVFITPPDQGCEEENK